MNICVYGAASSEIDQSYIDVVEALSEQLAKRGHNLIFGAGGSGLMGAAARGFHRGGAKVCGVVPKFFRDEKIENLYDEADNTIYTRDMGVRKHIMEENADAFIVCPGGIGTFDEFFQVLTLKQLGQHNKPIALFNIKGYYNAVQTLMKIGELERFLRSGCTYLYKCFDDGEEDELIEYIETEASDPLGKVEDYKYS